MVELHKTLKKSSKDYCNLVNFVKIQETSLDFSLNCGELGHSKNKVNIAEMKKKSSWNFSELRKKFCLISGNFRKVHGPSFNFMRLC